MAQVLTDAGESVVGDLVAAANWWIGWGTGAGTAAKNRTDLFTPAAESRVSATKSRPAADTNRFTGKITATTGKTITNGGVFTASSGGSLFIHADFAGIALEAGEGINFTFDIQWS